METPRLRIKEIREERGYSLSGFARRLGIAKGYLSEVESGKKGVTAARLALIARELGCSVQDIFEDSPAKTDALTIMERFDQIEDAADRELVRLMIERILTAQAVDLVESGRESE